jgi:hypothetical protein
MSPPPHKTNSAMNCHAKSFSPARGERGDLGRCAINLHHQIPCHTIGYLFRAEAQSFAEAAERISCESARLKVATVKA